LLRDANKTVEIWHNLFFLAYLCTFSSCPPLSQIFPAFASHFACLSVLSYIFLPDFVSFLACRSFPYLPACEFYRCFCVFFSLPLTLYAAFASFEARI
jgi:hypothetical protein